MRVCLFCLLLVILSVSSFAEDSLQCTLQPFNDLKTPSIIKDKGVIQNYPAARRLVTSLLKNVDTFDAKSSSAIVHVVRLSDPVKTTTIKVEDADTNVVSVGVQSSHWYAVDPTEDWSQAGASRLYGVKAPFVILIFLNAIEGSFDPAYTYVSTGRLPAPVQDLTDAVKLFNGVVNSKSAAKLHALWEGGNNPDGLFCWGQISVDVPGTIDITPKLDKHDNTAAIAIDQKPAEFDNEGFYHWDVSVGVPILSYKQLQNVTSSAGDATAEIDKRNLFLLGNWYVKAVDVKSTNFAKVPYIVAGASIASKPLHSILAGIGWGPTIANFYGGFLIITNNLPGNRTERVIKGGFGVNLPVRTIMGKLGINTQTTSGK